LLFTESRDLPLSQAGCSICAHAQPNIAGAWLFRGIFSAILRHALTPLTCRFAILPPRKSQMLPHAV
jgi:hypothetical protein